MTEERMDLENLRHRDYAVVTDMFRYAPDGLHREDREDLMYQIDKGFLTEESPRMEKTPDGFRDITLAPHQLTMIQAMQHLEKNHIRYSCGTNIGIVGDATGTGKSYSVLGHLLQTPVLETMVPNRTREVQPAWFMGYELEASKVIPANLLVVGSTLYTQWKMYISHTNLKVWYMDNKRNLPKTVEELIEKVEKEGIQVVLLKSTYWNEIAMMCHPSTTIRMRQKRTKELIDSFENSKHPIHEYYTGVRSLLQDYQSSVRKWNVHNMVSTRLSTTVMDKERILKHLSGLNKLYENLQVEFGKMDWGYIQGILDGQRERPFVDYVNVMETPVAWSRILIDEVDTIAISNAKMIGAQFYWFITSGLYNLMYPSGGVINTRRYFDDFYSPRDETIQIKGFRRHGFLQELVNLNTVGKCIVEYISKIYLKNKVSYVEESFLHVIPKPNVTVFWMKPSLELRMVRGIVPEEVQQNLSAGNIQGALELIGVTDTETYHDNLMEGIMVHLDRKDAELDKQKVKIQERIISGEKKLKSMEEKSTRLTQQLNQMMEANYSPESPQVQSIQDELEKLRINLHILANDIQMHRDMVDEIGEDMYEIHRKRDVLQDRVKETLKEGQMCCVCMDTYKYPLAITNCCTNGFCLECLTRVLVRMGNRCPMCRQNVQLENCQIVQEKLIMGKKPANENNIENENWIESGLYEKQITKQEVDDVHRKTDCYIRGDKWQVLCSLLKKIQMDTNRQAKICIFSEHDISFHRNVVAWMEKQGMKYTFLKGNSGAVGKRLDSFRENDPPVLLMNAKYFGSGLNLECCTHLIMFHEMEPMMHRQVIGRAQRYGRTSVLEVYYLLYETIEKVTSYL